MRSGSDRQPFALAAALVLALDAVTKYIAERQLGDGRTVDVIGDWVRFHLVFNRGAAFGLHLGAYSRWIFMGIAIVAVVLLYRFSRQAAPGDWLRQLALGLVAGGAFGNLVDRVRTARGVTDFIDVGIGMHRWPTFNIADSGVTCGAIALALSLWREDMHRAGSGEPSAPPTA
ncbi:MAG TPA: signal peptidase II [Gemmatimonadales bacterium]|jgi:signal peptidase II|nr:signal peptidase II [Gemmatimonadales bacterium]